MFMRMSGAAGRRPFNRGLIVESSGDMAGKRTAQHLEKSQGKQPSMKRQTRGGAPAEEAEEQGDGCAAGEPRSMLAPVSMSLSMVCGTKALAGGAAALEAALRGFAVELGGQEIVLGRTRVGPSDDTLHRVLPFVVVVESVFAANPSSVRLCYQTCKPWRQEMEARGFCINTFQLCSALAQDFTLDHLGPTFDHLGPKVVKRETLGKALRRMEKALRRLSATPEHFERALRQDAHAFLQRSWGWTGSLHQWLQAASQEPAASFLSRGAASTAQILGLKLVRSEDMEGSADGKTYSPARERTADALSPP